MSGSCGQWGLRLTMYGRQSSMPIFSPNRSHGGVSFSPTCDELVVISCADLLLLLIGIFGAFGSVGYIYTSRVFLVCMECFRKVFEELTCDFRTYSSSLLSFYTSIGSV